jgi:methionine-rich copper-binding protein CopC
VSGTTMSVPLRAAGPGTYHVNWRALSVDTHTTEGSFSFTVGGR